MAFDLRKLLTDVFEPQSGEVVVVACDVPAQPAQDHARWQERRAMAAEWREAFAALGRERSFHTQPLVTFCATGGNNRQLPSQAQLGPQPVALEQVLLDCTLAVFLTEYSATAPLTRVCEKKSDFRAASLPGLERRMESTGLAANYREVARRCSIIAALMQGAESLEVRFSTDDQCTFDLRFRVGESEDGYLPRHKRGDRIINLPSGEVFIVPYEGERPGEPSKTQGIIPIQKGDELARCIVQGNRIVEVQGNGPLAAELKATFARDAACANVAEVAFGCNEWAQVTGNVLEDEKAGFHWAYGRSEHLGGTVGPDSFSAPEHVLHQDIVYARGNPIRIAEATIVRGTDRKVVMRDSEYIVF